MADYSFSPSMNVSRTRSCSLISKQQLLFSSLVYYKHWGRNTVFIGIGPLEDECEKPPMARWVYWQRILSDVSTWYHFYEQHLSYICLHLQIFFIFLALKGTPFSFFWISFAPMPGILIVYSIDVYGMRELFAFTIFTHTVTYRS